eukprot:TRINITY_DN12266_c0_g1_i1.p1 TRINITY_DN12266_c0_g1~~TRINITY_DN12266_c0_g1_i1.p1  ORF type:complete len:371 (+),score=91.86 TRINITY_DN12266_c0_g1_i1:15-1127(+)
MFRLVNLARRRIVNTPVRQVNYNFVRNLSVSNIVWNKKSNSLPDFFNTNPPPDAGKDAKTELNTKELEFETVQTFSPNTPKENEKSSFSALFSGKPAPETTDSDKSPEQVKQEQTNRMFQALFAILDESKNKQDMKPKPSIQASQLKGEILEGLFGSKRKKKINELEFWELYPKQIKKWIMFTKSTKGYYDLDGKWVTVHELDEVLQNINTPTKDSVNGESLQRWEQLFRKEQLELPEDLRGYYRFGVKHDEIKDFHPKIRRLFSFKFATAHEILKHRKWVAIQKWKQHPTDTASDAIQIDILTQRIRFLTKYLKKNRQDKSNKRSLQRLIKRRKGLMKHLKKRDIHTYFAVLRDIKLPDLYPDYALRVY